jgi:hypothetical protein
MAAGKASDIDPKQIKMRAASRRFAPWIHNAQEAATPQV